MLNVYSIMLQKYRDMKTTENMVWYQGIEIKEKEMALVWHEKVR